MKTLSKFQFSILCIFISFLLFTTTSCEIEGCTDPNAINFDQRATTNSGLCQYERDRFLGQFFSESFCDGEESEITMTILESWNQTDEISIAMSVEGEVFVQTQAQVIGQSFTFLDTLERNNSIQYFEGQSTLIDSNSILMILDVETDYNSEFFPTEFITCSFNFELI